MNRLWVVALAATACVCETSEPWAVSPSALDFSPTKTEQRVVLTGATREQVSLSASIDDDAHFEVDAPGVLTAGSTRSIGVRLTAWAPALNAKLTLTDNTGDVRVIRLRTKTGVAGTPLAPIDAPLVAMPSGCPERPVTVYQLEPRTEFYPTAARANGDIAVRWRDQLALVTPDAGIRRFQVPRTRYSSLATREDTIAMLESRDDGTVVFIELSPSLEIVREVRLPTPPRVSSPTLLSWNQARRTWVAVAGGEVFEISETTDAFSKVSDSVERTGLSAVEIAGTTVFPANADGGLGLALVGAEVTTQFVSTDAWDHFASVARSDAGLGISWRQSGRGVFTLTTLEGVKLHEQTLTPETNLGGAVAWTGSDWLVVWPGFDTDGGIALMSAHFDEQGRELGRRPIVCGQIGAIWVHMSWAAGRGVVTYGGLTGPGGLLTVP